MSENEFLSNSMAHDFNSATVWDTVKDGLPGLQESIAEITR